MPADCFRCIGGDLARRLFELTAEQGLFKTRLIGQVRSQLQIARNIILATAENALELGLQDFSRLWIPWSHVVCE